MKASINKLACMNYLVDNGQESYYLQCGLESLQNFALDNGVDIGELCEALITKGYFVLDDKVTQIEMI